MPPLKCCTGLRLVSMDSRAGRGYAFVQWREGRPQQQRDGGDARAHEAVAHRPAGIRAGVGNAFGHGDGVVQALAQGGDGILHEACPAGAGWGAAARAGRAAGLPALLPAAWVSRPSTSLRGPNSCASPSRSSSSLSIAARMLLRWVTTTMVLPAAASTR